LRVVAYARVSTLLQEHPAAQLAQLRTVGAARGWEIVAEEIETASGADKKRPRLAAAMSKIRAGEGNALAATSLDRIGRSTLHLLSLVDDLRAFGAELICVNDGQLDTTTAGGRVVFTIRAAFAEFERELSRQRAREYAAVRKAAGLPHGRRDTLGPALAVAVKLRQAAPPLSWRAIAAQLAKRGLGDHDHATIARRVRQAVGR